MISFLLCFPAVFLNLNCVILALHCVIVIPWIELLKNTFLFHHFFCLLSLPSNSLPNFQVQQTSQENSLLNFQLQCNTLLDFPCMKIKVKKILTAIHKHKNDILSNVINNIKIQLEC